MSDGLTLEKMKVVERLNALESKLDILITELKISNESRDKNIDKLNHIIIGNGEKGLAERVRNLEEDEAKRKDYLRITWVAIIGLACKSIWDWIAK